jgi:RNA polymerase sigma-70 factor, ECF subfamily
MDAAPGDSTETRQLLDRVQAGDTAAFNDLIDRHRPALLGFLNNRIEDRLRARLDPSDIVQETQIVVFRRLDDYLTRRPMPFHLWVRKTAYEQWLMLRRQHVQSRRRGVNREIRFPEHSSLGLARRLSRQSSAPSQRLARAERAELVQQVLAKLSAEDRELLMMRNYEDLAYAEIAALLGITAAAARQRHGRALLRLSRMLADAGFGETTDG